MPDRRPNLFLIGAHKSATTSLFEMLKAHPRIAMSSIKEPGYFSIPEHAARGRHWYESLFRAVTDQPVIGEASTTYSLCGIYPGTADRILEYSPNARFVYLVRNPWERLASAWIQWRSEGCEIPDRFADALREFPALLDSARYWTQLNEYRRRVPADRVQVLFFEDFRRDSDAVVRQCLDFLGLEADHSAATSRVHWNESSNKREDSPILRQLRRVPGYASARDWLAPARYRSTFKRWLTVPIRNRPHWDSESLARVRDLIHAETLPLLGYCQRPLDFWIAPQEREGPHHPSLPERASSPSGLL
ncbi:MAG: sulfotransferase [Planctomycetes bacterium]|nr:sulfotransferase [Planctomycetota bacterium]